MRFWATKYIILAWVGGINLGFFSYHLVFRHVKRFIGLPLTFIVFFEGRNIIMKNCMDRIYYPLQPLYLRLRSLDKATTKAEKDKETVKPTSGFDDLKMAAMESTIRENNVQAQVHKELQEE